MTSIYPKRLIEVDLPIKRISAHARREKSIRHGHISTLHIWWARRPLAACRAVICASLWPDPADPLCPDKFIETAREEMLAWTSHERQQLLSGESCTRFEKARKSRPLFEDPLQLRGALLDFIADFANWDNSTVPEYLDTGRALTQAAHEALGGAPGTRPLVVDPFAGGGSIPLEALRVGADAFASDLNPVPVLLNKVVLEYIPKYGQRLADEVRKWGEWIKSEAESELGKFYPKDRDGAMPIAYLWARTIQCEGPGCGAVVPLIRSLWLAKKAGRSTALQLVPRGKAKPVDFRIVVWRASTQNTNRGCWIDQATEEVVEQPRFDGTIKRGAVTCPLCGYTTPIKSVRSQLKKRRGGANDAQLMCVATTRNSEQGRRYRLATKTDYEITDAAGEALGRKSQLVDGLTAVPNEVIPPTELRRISVPLYGLATWGDFFSNRQALSLTCLSRLVRELAAKGDDDDLTAATRVCLALAVDKQADRGCSLCRWIPQNENIGYTFGRQAIGMMWDFVEAPWSSSGGGWKGIIDDVAQTIELLSTAIQHQGNAQQSSATDHPLPDDVAQAIITDPPYYDAVPYAHLSDFFYVWLRRILRSTTPELFNAAEAPKAPEIVVDRPHVLSASTHDIDFYERELTKAFTEARRVCHPSGVGAIVFASKSTASWEAILKAVIESGWIISGSWAIDTEREGRMNAYETAALASSVHLVCRPRENPDGSVRVDEVGDWRDVLQELPRRIHEWMPRLAEEGVVGADAIFACLGPALEVFSRYSRVEKASGEAVTLKEYLEQVWAAVAKEALTMVFAGADTTGFEPDARLTAMWLWTLNAGKNGTADDAQSAEAEDEEEKKPKTGGFVLEYDAARKIAQGLGANLETLGSVIEVTGETARLLPVAERARYLFGKEEGRTPTRKKQQAQLDLFKVLEDADTDSEGAFSGSTVSRPGETVLDRIHQTMILFAAGRAEAVKRFLVEDGVGRDQRFWRLAQALSALYPASTEEKRWVDGVLARKKGLGL